MTCPDDRRYAKTHEWHKMDSGLVVVGLSRFAVDELTDITYLEIQTTEGLVARGESFGEIESVKATSDLYSGIDGRVAQVNQRVIDNPALINQDPYDQGWLIKITPDEETQLQSLMSAAEYERKYGG